mmetsp:Transcript_2021/g.4988  ORF Transcript_2021/g.4988 Transcript_2021/m.4988 type:complete len:247 (-) Transcript_2021:1521-2261(-)
MSNDWDKASKCNKPPASSRSELEMVPLGFSDVTKRSVIYCGHLSLQTTGSFLNPSRGTRWSAGNQTPPAPRPEASWWPSADPDKGTNSAILVGRFSISASIQRKSSNAWWTPLCRATRPFSLLVRACCMWLNRVLAPGRARDIERSSPKTLCHFRTLVRFCVTGMLDNISASRSMRCGGSWIVMDTVSMIHPSMILIVLQEQSPWSNFFKEVGWRLNGPSLESNGRKTSSIACIKIFRTRRLFECS